MSRPADRQRCYRRRVSSGKMIVPIQIDEVETVAALIAGGFLDPNAGEDRAAIGHAIEKLIAILVARDA